ncbi:hypothetical protein K2173_006585 [Erythroxylum novogranatense]|uniref:NPF family transporter n=1 Tax=Erythroxylum novogranatense TaxID=1862640 RepID=A0AAV8T5X3_9ROSI|nr:hypothetical protein K2173_006585 [Erythroxylum novogranatense]
MSATSITTTIFIQNSLLFMLMNDPFLTDLQEKNDVVIGKVDWKGRQALRHRHGGPRTAILPLATFALENMSGVALAVNLVTYIYGTMHFDLLDSANELTNFMGVSYILSILMALLADAFVGRLKIGILSGCLEFVGLVLLAVQAHYSKLRPPACDMNNPAVHCEHVEGGKAALFFVSLYMLALGSSGIKAAVPAHGADQFDEKDPKEDQQMSSYFNYVLFALCCGGVVGLTILVWVQDHKGWDWGFAICALALFLGVTTLLAGLPMYRIQVVRGSSVLLEIIQVYVASYLNRNFQLPEDPSELYEISNKEEAMDMEFLPHNDTLRWMDKAAILTASAEQTGRPETQRPWKLCRVTQVENAKILLSVLPIFCCTIIMTLCLAQLQTFSIYQGRTMDNRISKHFDLPPASIPIIPVLFLVILIPMYDRIIVPLLQKITGIPTGITHLQRIGVGLVLSCLSMATAALVEVKRKGVARDHNMLDAVPGFQQLPLKIHWLAIQYFIFGVADMFTYVGLLEFFYEEAPKALKSLSTCFLWTSMALGYLFSSIVVNIVNSATRGITRSGGWLAGNNLNRNHLNLFFWLLALMSFINFCIYVFVANRYKYRPKDFVDSNETKGQA